MYYFMSDIHGNARGYFAMKEKLNIDYDDTLYILGNIFDGNSENPQHCLAILDDIMKNGNIKLILGEHEYWHVLYHYASDIEAKNRIERKILRLDISGKPLLEYMKKLPQEKVDKYISYLVTCDMSDLIKIGERNFYLVHGAPVNCKELHGDVDKWQEAVASNDIDLERTYKEAIASDPNVTFDEGYRYEDTIIVCGNTIGQKVVNNIPSLKEKYYLGEHRQYERVVFYNNKMVINCGCMGDEFFSSLLPTLACVAIDEKGYSVTYNYDLFD